VGRVAFKPLDNDASTTTLPASPMYRLTD
jgi:hypothetical protein